MRKKRLVAHSLEDAIERCEEAAAAARKPRKVMEDLMGLSRSTYSRYTSDGEMPVRLIRQFETLCGASYVSDYLAMADGTRIVIDIPTGRAASTLDIAALQSVLHDAVGQIIQFAAGQTTAQDATSAISSAIAGLAGHKANINKHAQPELEFHE